MKVSQLLAVPMVVLIVLVSCQDGVAQTIAVRDIPYFIARIRVLDSWGDTLDFSRLLEWRIDSLAQEEGHFRRGPTKSPGDGACWAICDTAKGSSLLTPRQPLAPSRGYRFQLMKVMWGSQSLTNRLLTVWRTLPGDSVQFVGIDSVVSFAGIHELNNVMYFPDSSMMLYCGRHDWDYTVSKTDNFFRSVGPCRFQPLYATCWYPFVSPKVYVIADRLNDERSGFRVSEVTEYFSYPNPDTKRVFNASSRYVLDGSRLDSARIRVVDLWDLAKQRFGVDTLASGRDGN